MPRIIVALIRHGDYHQLLDTPSAWQPFALNHDGRQHALDAANCIQLMLQENHWVLNPLCHSSQLLRAWQTASILSAQLNLQFTHTPQLKQKLEVKGFTALAERSVGSLANLTNKKIAEIVQADPRYPELPENWKSNSLFCLPVQGAESLMQAGKRVAMHINNSILDLKKTATRDTLTLFVGHGAAFRHAAHQLGVLAFDQIASFSMHHGSAIFLELLANGQWQHIAGEWKVRPVKTDYTD